MLVKMLAHLPTTFSRTKLCSKDKLSSHAEELWERNQCVQKKDLDACEGAEQFRECRKPDSKIKNPN
jgi:hypothetical protein